MASPFICPNPVCGREIPWTGPDTTPVACPACGVSLIDDPPATLHTPPADPRETPTLQPAGKLLTVDLFPDSAAASPDSLPASIGRFQIRSRLGEGSFGEVFRAYDPQLDREVALKVAKPHTLDSPDRAQRFSREARAAANLRHPNIVPVFDSGRDGERYFIASGFIEGRTLRDEIDAAGKDRPLDLGRAAAVVRRLAEALGYAHRKGIIHRDVKPENILLDASGEPLVADFGTAARASEGELAGGVSAGGDGSAGEPLKTQAGSVIGTPAYMSPEQAAGKSAEATAASDQYALGVMLYEMATGRRPFSGPTAVVLFHHIETTPPRPRSINSGLPRDLEAVILRCLAKPPGSRYSSCEELAEDLRRFQDGEPVTARPLTWAERATKWTRRNPVVAGLLAMVLLVSMIGTIVSYANFRTAQEQEGIAQGKAMDADREATNAKTETKRATDEKTRADKEAEDAKTQAKLAADNAKESRRLLDLSRLRDADAAYERNLVQLARDTLDDIASENRCLAWGVVQRRAEGSLFTLYGHTSLVVSVAVSPDGRRIVTGSGDSTARVWDAVTGQALTELKGHTDGVTSVAVSPDGQRIVTGSGDKTARVWDAVTGQALTELKGHTSWVTSVAVSPDGRRIVTGSGDKTARVWDAVTGQALTELKGHTGWVVSVAVSPDGRRIVTGSGDNTARVWDAVTGQTLTELKGHTSFVTSVAVSPDGRRVITRDGAYATRVWDAETGRLLPDEPVPDTIVPTNQLPDGRLVVLSSGRVLIVDTQISDEELARRRGWGRPDADWHFQQQAEALMEKNPFAVAVHRSLEARAQGVLAFEAGDFRLAQGYFLQAARLRPQPPEVLEIAPPPRPVGPPLQIPYARP